MGVGMSVSNWAQDKIGEWFGPTKGSETAMLDGVQFSVNSKRHTIDGLVEDTKSGTGD
jgi:hypothetical protein